MDTVLLFFGILAIVFFMLFFIFLISWLVKRARDNKKREAKAKQMETLSHQRQSKGLNVSRFGYTTLCSRCGQNTGGLSTCPSCGEEL
jgi:uncharacterized membrane protein